MSPESEDGLAESDGPRRMSRRQFVGSAVAVGAAVVWTSQFPFAAAAIGQSIDPSTGPTGPTGTAATATGSTGSTGTSLPVTGIDAKQIGAVGAAAVVAGGAIAWSARKGHQGDRT